MEELKITYENTDALTPYANNPRFNDAAVDAVAASIEKFGFKVPIIISAEKEIVAGHTRLKAAKQLGLDKVPCIIADDLTDAQIKAFRLADNKVSEFADWNFEALDAELAELENMDFDMDDFGFEHSSETIETIWDKIKNNPQDSNLFGTFVEPPFSIIDTRTGRWKDRVAMWENSGLKSTNGRDENMVFAKGLNSGNINGTSSFDPALTELMYLWFGKGKNTHIIDPFTGGVTRGGVAQVLGYNYTGFDIREEQIIQNKKDAEENGIETKNISWIVDDAKNINNHVDDATQDLLFTCPPYFDLEKYSDMENDISNMDYDGFCAAYEEIMLNSFKTLRENSFAVIVISDVRGKDGEYLRLCDLTKDIAKKGGLKFYNEIILINNAVSAALRARRNMRNRKVVRTHQNILVFYNGDTTKVGQNFEELSEYEAYEYDERNSTYQ